MKPTFDQGASEGPCEELARPQAVRPQSRVAIIDCVGGASGNMLLGALLDAGLPLGQLLADLRSLTLPPFELEVTKVWRAGITATHVATHYAPETTVRHLRDIRAIIETSPLAPTVVEGAMRTFERLAHAEARIHGCTVEEIHFHEVGAMDAILDVVGFALGLHRLQIDEVHAGPVPVGTGSIACQHGLMPNPAPATAALLEGVPLRYTDWPGELVTPTGAALITSYARSYQFTGDLVVTHTGYGAGTRDGTVSNVTRLTLGHRPAVRRAPPGASLDSQPRRAGPRFQHDVVTLLETNIDDMNPQAYEHVIELLFEAGSLDVWLLPVHMKKLRPGIVLHALCLPQDADRLSGLLLEHTSSLGVRRSTRERTVLEREEHTLQTPWGAVRVKLALRGSPTLQPEYDDCRRIAQTEGLPLLQVMEEVRRLGRSTLTQRSSEA